MTQERWRKVKELYHAALARDPLERGAFLADACPADEELRSEIESLLAHDAGSNILDTPAAEFLTESIAGQLSPRAGARSLSPGDRLGPYEIVGRIGAGGMGAVYKGRDIRVGRTVAIKTPGAGLGAQFSGRFQREARAIASLNHPHICTLHDVGRDYLVMEYVEGRPVKGPLPLDEALRLALQLLDALDAAHRQGIVHRDLKPANILVTKSGVKVLDFGLAKMQSTAGPDVANDTLTEQGAIVGTLRYMSPEQVQGKDVDARSDLFSFGLVFYEMLTGRQAFAAENSASVIAAILTSDPPNLGGTGLAGLQRALRRSLAKDPADRWQSAADLKVALECIAEAPPGGKPVEGKPAAAQRGKLRATLYWLALAACLLVGAAAAFLFAPKPRGIGNYRFTPIEISQENPYYPKWAPHGQAFSYTATVGGKTQVFVRYLNSSTSTQMTHETSVMSQLGWSPDSKRIFIIKRNTRGDTPLRAVFSLSITGGEPEFVMPADWQVPEGISGDGKVLFVLRTENDRSISLATSSPVGAPLRRYSPGPFETTEPQFNALGNDRQYSPANLPHLKLAPDGSRILFFLNRSGQEEAWSLPFPAGSGTPKQILKNLPHYGTTPAFTWFPDSRHIAISLQERQGDAGHLWIVDTVTGSRTPLTTGLFDEFLPTVAPNGKQILFVESTANYKLVAASLEDATLRTVISSQRPLGMPAWARKPDKFAYETDGNGQPEIWLHEGDGSGHPLATPAIFPAGTTNWWMNPALSPAGDRLAYTRLATDGGRGIWISSVAGGSPVRLTNRDATEYMASWSPDGGRIAYLQVKGEILFMICKTSGQASPIELRSKIGNYLPDWSPSGEWITFRDNSGWNLISPDGKTTRTLGKIETPHLTFSKDGQTLYGIRAEKGHRYLFSVSLNGKQMKTIGEVGSEFWPRSYFNPGMRFSLSPDGKSILYPSYSIKSSLWMLEGFDAP